MAHPQQVLFIYDQSKHQVLSDFLPNNVNLQATISWGEPYSLRNVNNGTAAMPDVALIGTERCVSSTKYKPKGMWGTEKK